MPATNGSGMPPPVKAPMIERYGMLLADNGSNWFISGATDTRRDDDDLGQLKKVRGSAFEVVRTGPILH